ncbi:MULTISPECIES: hypothetical protein [unclassified Ensifer]|uniref:hypothetical protein n=1 Tax=unclassified Ensifer TaxID=2633371 RepID=UPI000812DC65|nr:MULTISPECIES: hypothetical protein [unclassified Ensifer]OCP19680.1 hypothetical protein BC361_30210 [Ensifer sp. LC54]OCP19711.1 hypothetical protein BC363_30515 [Ensifer sp. LC384]
MRENAKTSNEGGGRMFPSDDHQEQLVKNFTTMISHMTVGFVHIPRHGSGEYADPAGTGTLVRIGPIFGILTAAHVLDALSRHEEVGLMRITNRPDRPQKMKIDMRAAETVMIGELPFGSSGPDIGFLRLPNGEELGWLKSKNIFFNLEKPQPDPPSSLQALPCFHLFIGVVAERTEKAENTETNSLLTGMTAMASAATILREGNANGLDILDIDIGFAPGVKRPTSFGGMSGGGLWQVCLDAEQQQVRDRRPVGVAFYQSDLVNGQRTVTCHGPQTIYTGMLAQIRAKWPN